VRRKIGIRKKKYKKVPSSTQGGEGQGSGGRAGQKRSNYRKVQGKKQRMVLTNVRDRRATGNKMERKGWGTMRFTKQLAAGLKWEEREITLPKLKTKREGGHEKSLTQKGGD